MTTSDLLKLKLVTADDCKSVKNFIREFFLENEPINQYLFSKECKDFSEGLSYMHITETGQIAALGLVGYKVSSASGERVTPILQKLTRFFDMVEEAVKPIANLTENDKQASFRVLAVHPHWIGHGLAKLLVKQVITSLKSLGFTHIRSFCSSAYSTKLFEKYGFKKLYSIKYADYTRNGEVVFLPKEPHTHLNYMQIKL